MTAEDLTLLRAAVIEVNPKLIAAANPWEPDELLIEATSLEDLHTTVVVRFCVELSV